MNRIIKFRIWDTIDKKFETLLLEPIDTIGAGFIHFYPVRKIFQEFTGLIDKNGREIYEGDIVNFTVQGYPHTKYPEDYKNQVVKWDEKYAFWAFGPEDIGMLDRLCDIEIVGNVFENPDLLNAN